jgi:hypothetical protein
MLALTYSATNSALYLDSKLVTNGAPVAYWPGPEVLTNGFFIGAESNGLAQAHGMLDGLYTYANPVDAGSVRSLFIYGYAHYRLRPRKRANIASAPSAPVFTPTFVAITGPGYLENLGTVNDCVTNSSVWLTNVVATLATNGTMNLAFTIAGGSNSLAYDVYATAALESPITNALWAWMGQGYPCHRYGLTDLPDSAAFLIVGTPTDSDADGLPDAYELLVSHTDPQSWDTNGDGIGDGIAVLQGRNPRAPGSLPDTNGAIHLQVYTPLN